MCISGLVWVHSAIIPWEQLGGIVFGLGAIYFDGLLDHGLFSVQRISARKIFAAREMAPISARIQDVRPLIVILPRLLGLAVLPDKNWFPGVGGRGDGRPQLYNDVSPAHARPLLRTRILGLGVTALIAVHVRHGRQC